MTRTSRVGLVLIPSVATVVIIFSLLIFVRIPHDLHTRVYWLLGSRHYKREVLASPRVSTDLLHAEWQGGGWGGVPIGDWMGYVVYDPNDPLPITGTNRPPIRVAGIPCEVVAVRRMEKNRYSVVANMNQFLDTMHPNCQSPYS